MFYRYGGAFLATMTDTNRWVRMYQSPKLEFVVNQDCWWCTETKLADVILPACTNLERDDISEWASSGGYSAARVRQRQPPGHRLPAEVRRAGGRVQGRLRYLRGTGGPAGGQGGVHRGQHLRRVDREDVRLVGHAQLHGSYKDFKEKGYFVVPQVEDYKATPALRWFYEGRPCDTPDDEQPQARHRQGRRAGDAQRQGRVRRPRACSRTRPTTTSAAAARSTSPAGKGTTSELAAKYPLQLISPHPRFSFHTQHDTHVPWLSEIPGHRTWSRTATTIRCAACTPTDAEGQGHQARRRRQALQRPRLRPPGRLGDRAREAGGRPLVRGGVQVRPPRARQGRQHRPGRLRQPAHPVADDVEERARHGAQLLSRGDGEVGGLSMTRYGMVMDVTRCNGCYNCFLACKDEYLRNAHPAVLRGPADDRPGVDADRRTRNAAGSRRSRWTTPPIPCMHCDNAACVGQPPMGPSTGARTGSC